MNSSNPPANMRNLSKMVAQMWEQESPEVKQYWDQVAERIKLNSSYRSSFDVINGLDMSISESDITFVNATASSSQSATKKNKKTKIIPGNICYKQYCYLFNVKENGIVLV
ncbi:hypothetical protein RhiirC2_850417 [Rhizophagus irregularis]|uniref:HMG box domain-containing protein n=1 Tax=Rhizophagus irregularis TaxID=588596 RepID=A0A2N1N7F3_9GLOM|nr:hypothetical protein RhiirC2_850417 [Rhizophagus irregularis]